MPSFSKWKQYFCTSEKWDYPQCEHGSTAHFVRTNYTCTLLGPPAVIQQCSPILCAFPCFNATGLLLLFFDRMVPQRVQFLKGSQIDVFVDSIQNVDGNCRQSARFLFFFLLEGCIFYCFLLILVMSDHMESVFCTSYDWNVFHSRSRVQSSCWNIHFPVKLVTLELSTKAIVGYNLKKQ